MYPSTVATQRYERILCGKIRSTLKTLSFFLFTIVVFFYFFLLSLSYLLFSFLSFSVLCFICIFTSWYSLQTFDTWMLSFEMFYWMISIFVGDQHFFLRAEWQQTMVYAIPPFSWFSSFLANKDLIIFLRFSLLISGHKETQKTPASPRVSSIHSCYKYSLMDSLISSRNFSVFYTHSFYRTSILHFCKCFSDVKCS